jgi:hypothetical protein
MDKSCAASGAGAGPGLITTFYADDSAAARSLVLANMAWYLSSAPGAYPRAGAPVLMIDWDLAAPGLHHLFGSAGERPGLLEFVAACRSQLAALAHGNTAADGDELARQVLAAVDWRGYIEPVDPARSLYLMRAGRVDASWNERAAQCDWHGLFQACPALLRQWRAQMAQAFRHVLIDAPGGRSAGVSTCTSLLADRIVGLFTPAQGSLDGLCGVMQRAIAYRCSHEEEQRPLLLYPLPCVPAGASPAALAAWRQGGAAGPGYQAILEGLMQASYGRTQLALDSYLDKVMLPHLDEGAGAVDQPGAGLALLVLLDWAGEGYFPWQSHTEVVLLRSRAGGRHAADPGTRRGHAPFQAVRQPAGHDARRLGVAASALHPTPAPASL